MSIVIPVFDESSFTEQITLNGEVFKIGFKYNSRDDTWHMDIARRDGTVLVAGRKLVAEFTLFLRFKYMQDMPKGDMLLFDTKGEGQETTRDDFIDRHILSFLTDEEIAAI
jgi:hypothetical protein